MSSSSGLGRTRSMRKPAAGSNASGQRDGPATTRGEARNVSPSRLPTKPAMTTRSTAAGTTTISSSSAAPSRTRTTSSVTGRPPSGILSKPPSARQDHAGTAPAKPLGRAPSARQVSSSAAAPPPAASFAAASRSTSSTASNSSTGRPRSSGGPPPTAANRDRQTVHSRSKSTITSLTAATTLHPAPQQPPPSAASSDPSSSGAATAAATTSSGPRTRSQTHARARSQSVTTQATTQHQPQRPLYHPPAAAVATAALANRPAFNTHQQHYSPAKSLRPKPLTSTFLAPPSPSKLPANVALSAETSRLQTELLQLSLLRRDAPAVDAEWHASARATLGARFARLAADHDALVRRERDGVETSNAAALARWGNATTPDAAASGGLGLGLGLEAKLQILDEVLDGVWQLGEPGSRYQRVARRFEAWADRAADIAAARRAGDIAALVDDGDEVRFLGGLDAAWKQDRAGLVRRLDGWRASLRELGPPADLSTVDDGNDGVVVVPGKRKTAKREVGKGGAGGAGDKTPESDGADTGLARALRGATALVGDMLAELAVMEEIQREAARAEDAWIESMDRAIAAEDYGDGAAGAAAESTYVPLWKLAV
ncbi:hypothetical protein GGS23DRAFT_618897 [Durotheca rogersii]|uniref:uncharacterized protein n=1 Tax=Durotheca rogersii TaxID=419775 RepID=UPI00222079CF|nr:uncharacterized protein GGS23DRAFT_618897 [Durotheca rogersii]KAI5855587.1 hypothetical protein GGS23DRAFT_618897 [Durotheca rogersii]